MTTQYFTQTPEAETVVVTPFQDFVLVMPYHVSVDVYLGLECFPAITAFPKVRVGLRFLFFLFRETSIFNGQRACVGYDSKTGPLNYGVEMENQ